MKVTFICKNLTDAFYNGNGGSIQGINNLSGLDRLEKLFEYSRLSEYQVTSKIGDGSFCAKVDLNALKRRGWSVDSYKLENRKGYKLLTFEVI